MLSNKSCYVRNKSFIGNFKEWFNTCVDEDDLFRIWLKGNEDCECDYYYIVNVIEIPNDYLLGLSIFDQEYSKDRVSIHWQKLSEIFEIAIVPDEEDLYNTTKENM